MGGGTTTSDADSNAEVRQYNTQTNSWNVISLMRVKRRYPLAVVVPGNALMVCGGFTSNAHTTSVEFGSFDFMSMR